MRDSNQSAERKSGTSAEALNRELRETVGDLISAEKGLVLERNRELGYERESRVREGEGFRERKKQGGWVRS